MTKRHQRTDRPAGLRLCAAAMVLVAGPLWAQTPPPGALFTEAQAERGEKVFLRNCAGCHGYSMISIFSRYRNAYDYHSVISLTMPWEDAGLLSDENYIDIVAYMMRENGFGAGEVELVPDRALLENIIPPRAGSR